MHLKETMNDSSGNITIARLFFSFFQLGMSAFGGLAMIPHMKGLTVTRNKWLDEETFRNGIVLCQTLPGATAMQMAAYVGLKTRGIWGALASYAGFGIPAFSLMLTLSVFYAGSRNLTQIVSLFTGLQVLVVAIIAHATFSFGRDSLKSFVDLSITAVSAALFWWGVSPFAVILCASLGGVAFFKDTGQPLLPSHRKLRENKDVAKHLLIFLLLIGIGLAGLYGVDKKLFSLATMLLRIDLFAFGGGFASQPLMFHEIVNVRGWLDSRTFMDGIALGQVTPGPIIITATFVGYLVSGLAGALTATVAIFTPSFVLLVTITPFFDRLKGSRCFAGATRGVLAAIVGLLLYMTIKFAVAVPWEISKVLFMLAMACALFRRINLLLIVLIGSVISVVVFR